MIYWPWWVSGLALSAVMLFHWLTLHRMMAVSGRVSSLVDRLRHREAAPSPVMSREEMLAAIQAATIEEFGASNDIGNIPEASEPLPVPKAHPSAALHVLFLLGLVLGGALATFLSVGFQPTPTLKSEGFSALTREIPVLGWGLLLFGGAFVGFGTRMAGGCTSGHGLCGTSRLQPGSMLTTLAFFATGIIVSFGLGVLL